MQMAEHRGRPRNAVSADAQRGLLWSAQRHLALERDRLGLLGTRLNWELLNTASNRAPRACLGYNRS